MAQSHAHKIDPATIPDPSSVGPRGNPGNHNNQGYKNAIQVAEFEQRFKVEELYAKHGTTSAVIRFLTSQGMEVGAIAKFLNIRYQQVRNVVKAPISH